MTKRHVLTMTLPTLLVWACSGAQEMPARQAPTANHGAKTTQNASGNAQAKPAPVTTQAPVGNAGDATAATQQPLGADAGGPGGSIGDKAPTGADLMAAPPDVTETFAGAGSLAFVDHNYDVQQRTTIKTTAASLVVQITQSSSSNGDVNDGLQSSIGATTFARVDAVKANIPVAQRFLLFTNAVQGSSGRTAFSAPLPVFAYPSTTMTRYSALDTGAPLAFSASATGPAGQHFTVNVSVAKAAAAGGGVGIAIKANIPEDHDGTLYQLIGLSAATVESIDLGSGRVVSMATDQFYHTDKTPGNPFDQMGGFPGGFPGGLPSELQQQANQMSQRQPMHIDYRLCTYTGPDGKTQNLGC